jgi:hypothetical protein
LRAALIVLLFLDLVPRTWNSIPLETRSYFDSAPKEVWAVKGSGGRFYYDRETEVAPDPLRPMQPAMWGVDFAGNNDIDRFSPRRSFFFARALASLGFSDPRKRSLLALADVRAVSTIDPSAAEVLRPWFATSPRRVVYRVEGGRRFRLFSSAISARGEEDSRGRVLDTAFDGRSTVVLESPVSAATGELEEAIIRPIRRRSDRELLSVTSSSGGYLFRAETYDPHWTATVDGMRAGVVPADFAFQAVPVPPGTHRVEFSYADGPVAAAMAVSLAALIFVAFHLGRSLPA